MLQELKGGTSSHKARARLQRRRTARNVIMLCTILAIVFLAAGFGYAWYAAKSRPEPVAVAKLPDTAKPTKTPAKIDENAPVGVSVQMLTSPITPGANAAMSIKTRPHAACSIKVTYGDKASAQAQTSTDAGLVPKTADEFGVVNWTWTVEVSRPIGTWPVDVVCAYNKQSGVVRGDLQLEAAKTT